MHNYISKYFLLLLLSPITTDTMLTSQNSIQLPLEISKEISFNLNLKETRDLISINKMHYQLINEFFYPKTCKKKQDLFAKAVTSEFLQNIYVSCDDCRNEGMVCHHQTNIEKLEYLHLRMENFGYIKKCYLDNQLAWKTFEDFSLKSKGHYIFGAFDIPDFRTFYLHYSDEIKEADINIFIPSDHYVKKTTLQDIKAFFFHNVTFDEEASKELICKKEFITDIYATKLLLEHNSDVLNNSWGKSIKLPFTHPKKDSCFLDIMCSTPLMLAVENKNIDIVQFLLNKGIKNYNTNNYKMHHYYLKPFIIACSQGNVSITALLYEYVYDINKTFFKKNTALHFACQNNHAEVVTFLLEHGANPNRINKYGFTPLFIASQEGHTEIVQLLLENNADANLSHKTGVTPLFMASQNGHTEVAELLREYGAEE